MAGSIRRELFRSDGRVALVDARANRWLDRRTISQAFPYPISSYYVVLMGTGGTRPASVPPRIEVPPLDEGPHKSYAIQWFSFAAISIIGTILYLRRK